MNIFYFGGTSFTSQYLIKDLSKKSNVINFSRTNSQYCKSYYFNLNKKPNKFLTNKFNFFKPDFLFIFSSFVPLNEQNSSWKECKKVNVIGLMNLLKTIKFKPKKIILASSCSLYGPDISKKKADSFLAPSSGYSLSKFAQENILRIFCKKNNIKFLSYRIGYVFGSNMSKKRLVKRILINLRKNKKINLFDKKKNLNLIHTKDISRIIMGTFKRSNGVLNLVSPYKTTLGLYFYYLKKEKKINKIELKYYFKNLKRYKDFQKIKIFSFKDAINDFKNEN